MTGSQVSLGVGRALRATRQAYNLTQTALARKVGVPQSTISKLEACERQLLVVELHEICKAIGITMSDFVGRLEHELEGEGSE
jgi:transcriptional regulator with XRE-family HTH domain